MDIQFVTNVFACAMYIASYVTKSQRGMSELLRKAADEAKLNDGAIFDRNCMHLVIDFSML